MTKFILSALIITMVYSKLHAQNDTIKSVDLLNELSLVEKDTMPLLPKHIMISQRMLWGKKGLMRNFDAFELTPEKRQDELKIRRAMLVTHQITGFATLAGMIAQGIIGAKLYNGDYNLKDAHEAMGTFVNIGFFTTASLSLFAPPKMVNEHAGYSSIKLHRYLGVLSIASMVVTDILAGQLEGNPDLKPYHRAAAYTAFGSFAAQIIVIKF